MSGDILSMYGPGTPQSMAPQSSNGGKQTPKPMPYSAPMGPKGINDSKTPGIHGTNHGCCGTQGKR